MDWKKSKYALLKNQSDLNEEQEIKLLFSGFSKGKYALTTYHHPRTEGPLLNQVEYELTDAEGKRQQKGLRSAMGYYDEVRTLEQKPLSGESRFTVGADGRATVTVSPVQDKKGAFWLNGLELRRIL